MKRIRIQVAITLLTFAASEAIVSQAHAASDAVTITERDVTIPTYLAGDPDPNPIFYFGRASQGAQGRVYPYPLYDSLTGDKTDKTYKLIYLENEFVRIGILPEIGGRLFEAVDKTNNYDFIYHQHVIKPALIGLIGAWMSGGIEWNIPHHHRATTFLPVQSKIEENADGSKTVWVGELELRTRMRWAVGYTLYPGKSYLECKVRIINRTPFANTMLCFANVAVHANDNYQVIFPPVHAVRHLPRQARIHHLADRHHALQRRRFHRRRRRELVQSPPKCHVDVRLELHRRFLRRLRPRQRGRHRQRGRS